MSPSKKMITERQGGARDSKVLTCQAASGGLSAGAYNPSSGTFHTLETLNADSETGYLNGRLKSMDEMDDSASSHGGSADMDCMSNSGSCSGESEYQHRASAKDKTPPAKPGTGGADKRDKIRGKNERKHQRQRERRAQELRDKCNGYLMSRKLECLSQKLVAMGFSQEQATMALIVNNGHVEQSVAWLLEGGEGQVHEDCSPSENIKIDISEELDQLLEIEKKYKFPRLDIERAVVFCEGDLEKALDSLWTRNVSAVTEKESKIESRIADAVHPACSPVKFDNPTAYQPKGNSFIQPPHQLRYVKVAVPSFEGRLIADACIAMEGSSKNSHLSVPQSLVSGVEMRTIARTVPVKIASHMPSFTPASNAETGLVFGFGAPDPRLLFSSSIKDHFKNASVEESAHKAQACRSMLQLNPQPIGTPKNIPMMSPAFPPPNWTSKMDVHSPSSVLYDSDGVRMQGLASIQHSLEGSGMGSGDLADWISSLVVIQAGSQLSPWNGVGRGLPYDIVPALATQSGSPSGSPCGLFTGWDGRISQSSIDWSTGPIRNCDYRNIDWSMNATQTATQGISNQRNFSTPQMKNSDQCDFQGERRFRIGGRAVGFPTDLSNSGPPGAAMQDKVSHDFRNAGSLEWTSPFAGKALFDFPQAVSSPLL